MIGSTTPVVGRLGCALVLFLMGTHVKAQSSTVRLATVRVPDDSGLLGELLPGFEKQTGYRVEVLATTTDVYDVARAGRADLVISHYGFSELERFVQEGSGLWPRTVFANQVAFLGPPDDPSSIRGLTDAVEGFRRVAQMQSPFVVNNDPVTKQLTELLWEAAGRPERGDWYRDVGLEGPQAIETAAKQGAYTLWGFDPFHRFQERRHLPIESLILNDPVLQRIMVSVVVNPERIPGVNREGAEALQRYLTAPSTQARIRAFRYPDVDDQVWYPAALHNVLPDK
jgi:tungstate transport system substrate-binding protein